MTCSQDQKVTTMLLKVDLDCYQCYKKVKKLLCQFPQIRNQVFDDKNNVVIITVVCCSPEKIRDKLCRKGGKSIKSIEIKQLVKPAPPATSPAQPSDIPKPEKPKQAPGPAPEQKPSGKMEKNGSKNESNKPNPGPAAAPEQADTAPKPAPPSKQQEPVAQWVPGYPSVPPPQMLPIAVYSTTPSYEVGPCYGPGSGYGYHYGYGRPCPPAYYGSRCDYYTSEENAAACSIM